MVHEGGRGGQKSPKNCPHGLWMPPKKKKTNVRWFCNLFGSSLTFCSYVHLGLSKDLRWSEQVPFKSWLMDGQKDKNSDEKLSFVKKVYQPFQ